MGEAPRGKGMKALSLDYLLNQQRKLKTAINLAVSPKMAAYPKAMLAAVERKLDKVKK